MRTWSVWSRHVAVAGGLLIVLGALWAAIGVVLLVAAWLYSNAASLPNWVTVAPGASVSTAPRLGLIGVGTMAAGLGQLAAGAVLQRRSGGWAGLLGLGLAVIGAAVLASWLVSGLTQGRPVLVLLPALAAYLYAGTVLAARVGAARPG